MPVDLDALASKLGAKDAESAAPVDLEALANHLGATDGPMGALSKATSIDAVPRSARYAEHLPIVGGLIGGIAGDIPGAAIGGMVGKRIQQYINALSGYAHLPDAKPAIKDVLKSGAEQGLMETGSKVVSGALRAAPFRPTAAADVALAKTNKELGLRLSPADIVSQTATGKAGRAVEQMAERSVSGGIVGDLNRQITQRVAKEGIVQGKAALNQVGEALHQVVTSGPTYDMLPHRMEAAKIFSQDVAPKILDLYERKLSPQFANQLRAAANGGLSPDLAQKLIPAIRKVIQRGQTAPVPTGTLDALESILQTGDSTSFESATNLRTSLLEIGRGKDAVLGSRGKALTSKFAGDLTSGLQSAYPAWEPPRRLFAAGAEALRLPNVSREQAAMVKAGPTAYKDAVRAATGKIPTGTEEAVLTNLRTLDDALARARASGGAWGDRIYRTFELASTIGAGVKYGPQAAAGTLAVTELLPGLIVWAAHNPTMTKILQEGLLTKDPKIMTSLLGRATQSYLVAQRQAAAAKKADAPQAVGQ